MNAKDDLIEAAKDWSASIDRETAAGSVDAEILDDLIREVEMHPLDVQAWLAEQFGEEAAHAYADRFPGRELANSETA